jgi:hypothetical protein
MRFIQEKHAWTTCVHTQLAGMHACIASLQQYKLG